MKVYTVISARRVGPSPWLVPAIFLGLALVTAFTMVGRMIHGYDLGFLGVAHTAWPFIVGALLGWRAIAKSFARRSAILQG